MKYYCKMPPDIAERQVFVVDPMLATGGSASATLDILKKEYGCHSLTMLNILAAPGGRRPDPEGAPGMSTSSSQQSMKSSTKTPTSVPGLGDAGDRIFGTK